jgi:hypothetical protein
VDGDRPVTGRYEAHSFTRHHDRAVHGVNHHGQERLAAILLLSTVLTELRGAGPGDSVWGKLNRLTDDDLGALSPPLPQTGGASSTASSPTGAHASNRYRRSGSLNSSSVWMRRTLRRDGP